MMSKTLLRFLEFFVLCTSIWSFSLATFTATTGLDGKSYKLVDFYRGEHFMTEFQLTKDGAKSAEQIDNFEKTEDNTVYVNGTRLIVKASHDSSQKDSSRVSVKLCSKKTWESGLFVFNVNHVPQGKGVRGSIIFKAEDGSELKGKLDFVTVKPNSLQNTLIELPSFDGVKWCGRNRIIANSINRLNVPLASLPNLPTLPSLNGGDCNNHILVFSLQPEKKQCLFWIFRANSEEHIPLWVRKPVVIDLEETSKNGSEYCDDDTKKNDVDDVSLEQINQRDSDKVNGEARQEINDESDDENDTQNEKDSEGEQREDTLASIVVQQANRASKNEKEEPYLQVEMRRIQQKRPFAESTRNVEEKKETDVEDTKKKSYSVALELSYIVSNKNCKTAETNYTDDVDHDDYVDCNSENRKEFMRRKNKNVLMQSSESEDSYWSIEYLKVYQLKEGNCGGIQLPGTSSINDVLTKSLNDASNLLKEVNEFFSKSVASAPILAPKSVSDNCTPCTDQENAIKDGTINVNLEENLLAPIVSSTPCTQLGERNTLWQEFSEQTKKSIDNIQGQLKLVQSKMQESPAFGTTGFSATGISYPGLPTQFVSLTLPNKNYDCMQTTAPKLSASNVTEKSGLSCNAQVTRRLLSGNSHVQMEEINDNAKLSAILSERVLENFAANNFSNSKETKPVEESSSKSYSRRLSAPPLHSTLLAHSPIASFAVNTIGGRVQESKYRISSALTKGVENIRGTAANFLEGSAAPSIPISYYGPYRQMPLENHDMSGSVYQTEGVGIEVQPNIMRRTVDMENVYQPFYASAPVGQRGSIMGTSALSGVDQYSSFQNRMPFAVPVSSEMTPVVYEPQRIVQTRFRGAYDPHSELSQYTNANMETLADNRMMVNATLLDDVHENRLALEEMALNKSETSEVGNNLNDGKFQKPLQVIDAAMHENLLPRALVKSTSGAQVSESVRQDANLITNVVQKDTDEEINAVTL